MIRTIIVDDEQPARELLKSALNEYCEDIEIAGLANSAKSAYALILLHKPDLIFLDVEMPNGSGFDLLKKFRTIDFKVIFVTAFYEYAVKAFRFSATDYLLKPVAIHELIESIDKVRNEINHKVGNRNIEELIRISSNPALSFQQITIPDKRGFRVLNIREIIRCEAEGYCTLFYLSGGKRITSSKNLKFYEEILEEKGFLRVHNSHLVNLEHIAGFDHEGIILLSDNQTAPLGNTYKKRFTERFQPGK